MKFASFPLELAKPLLRKAYTRDAYAPLLCRGINWACAGHNPSSADRTSSRHIFGKICCLSIIRGVERLNGLPCGAAFVRVAMLGTYDLFDARSTKYPIERKSLFDSLKDGRYDVSWHDQAGKRHVSTKQTPAAVKSFRVVTLARGGQQTPNMRHVVPHALRCFPVRTA
jgi:hypothetical protein